MRWTENYIVNSHDPDMNNVVSVSGLMRYMQDVANCQMEGEKPSYNDLLQQGKAFVLSRLRMSIYHPLYNHDKIEAQSWACESSGASFNRCYCIKKDGVIVAEATSVWALLDIKTRRLCRVSDFENGYSTDEMLQLDLPARFRIPQEIPLSLVGERCVEYQDVDMNHHINNTRYPDILCGYLPTMEGMRVIKIEINYISEAPLGEAIKVYMGTAGEGTYYFRTVRGSGKTNVEAEIVVEEI